MEKAALEPNSHETIERPTTLNFTDDYQIMSTNDGGNDFQTDIKPISLDSPDINQSISKHGKKGNEATITANDRLNLNAQQLERLEVLEEMIERAEQTGDYVRMNRIHEEVVSIRSTYDPYYADWVNYDVSHGGKIHTFWYSYEKNGETIYGAVYMIGPDVNEKNQTIGENDFIVKDQRNFENPAMEILDGYKADSKEQRMAVLEAIIAYDKVYPRKWTRGSDIDNLEYEWWKHNVAYHTNIPFFKNKGRDVHLDNAKSGAF